MNENLKGRYTYEDFLLGWHLFALVDGEESAGHGVLGLLLADTSAALTGL